MKLSVSQTFQNVETGDVSEIVVWEWEDGVLRVRAGGPPPGIIPGLLKTFVDGVGVSVATFDAKLAEARLTRKDIEEQLRIHATVDVDPKVVERIIPRGTVH